jgi:hypothetical protein
MTNSGPINHMEDVWFGWKQPDLLGPFIDRF